MWYKPLFGRMSLIIWLLWISCAFGCSQPTASILAVHRPVPDLGQMNSHERKIWDRYYVAIQQGKIGVANKILALPANALEMKVVRFTDIGNGHWRVTLQLHNKSDNPIVIPELDGAFADGNVVVSENVTTPTYVNVIHPKASIERLVPLMSVAASHTKFNPKILAFESTRIKTWSGQKIVTEGGPVLIHDVTAQFQSQL